MGILDKLKELFDKLYYYALFERDKIVAYSLHYSKGKAIQHLRKIKKFHSLSGEIEEYPYIKEMIIKCLLKNECIQPAFAYYKYNDLYRFLYSHRDRLFYYSEIMKMFGLSRFGLINALKHNPMLIIIPCHNIVGKRDIGGYTPLGKEVKKLLIEARKLLRSNIK